MIADVAGTEGTQDGVGQRVQADVGVGVAYQPGIVVDAQTAERHVIARPEGMHVEALANTYLGPGLFRSAAQPALRRPQVILRGHLQVLPAAFNQCHRQAGPLGHSGVVRQGLAGGRAMRRQDLGEGKPLGGLGAPQAVAVLRAGDLPVVRALQGIHHGQGGDGPGRGLQRAQYPVDHRGRDEGAGAIVDQHPLRRPLRQALETAQHRLLPLGTAGDRLGKIEPLRRGVVEVAVVGMDHRADPGDAGMRGESPQAVPQQRHPGQLHVLLGQAAAKTLAAPGGDDQRVGRLPLGSVQAAALRDSTWALRRETRGLWWHGQEVIYRGDE